MNNYTVNSESMSVYAAHMYVSQSALCDILRFVTTGIEMQRCPLKEGNIS
jgi:hypothetical protein